MSVPILPILMYHHVSPNPGLVTLSPAAFREQMAWLARSGWHTPGAREIEAFHQGQPLPRKSVVITFDDGYLDNWVHAQPVLAEFQLKALLFISTDWIGSGPLRQGPQECPDHRSCKARIAAGDRDGVMLRWAEVEAMAAAGTFEFHSHSHTHTRWDRQLPPGSARQEALAADLARSREILIQRLGSCSRHLCWPQGYYDPDYVATAQSQGFDHLYTTERRLNAADQPPLRLGRISTKEREDSGWLKRRLFVYGQPLLSRLYMRLQGDR
ncbi:MAG: polysaccharide deacetylase family protein [Azovibrio sp.]|nr:polysaccharide deacetylase family protein [Azovibrio sp.]